MSNTQETEQSNYRWWEIPGRLEKIEQAFAIGCTDQEACNYAEITPDQLYYYTREISPEFQARKEALKEKPILKAKQTIVKSLDQPEHAKWYLERKAKHEFSARSELTGEGGERILIPIYGGNSVPEHNSNQKDIRTTEEN